jgi:cell division protein FtsZ
MSKSKTRERKKIGAEVSPKRDVSPKADENEIKGKTAEKKLGLALKDDDLKKRVCAIGVGGGGMNAIERMYDDGIKDIELFALNTDAEHLLLTKVNQKLLIGKKTCRGLGAGSTPKLGEEAAIENEKDIREIVKGRDLVFVLTGLGGGTGSGAVPVIAKIAKEEGALAVARVNLPFTQEGDTRIENAEVSLKKLFDFADTTIVIHNDKLLEIVSRAPLSDAFHTADKIFKVTIEEIKKLAIKGLFSFSEFEEIIKNGYFGIVGIGEGSSSSDLNSSVKKALCSPFFEPELYSRSTKALVSITGDSNLKPSGVRNAITEIANKLSIREENILYSSFVDKLREKYVRVVVIATGIKSLLEKEIKEKETTKNYGIDILKLK